MAGAAALTAVAALAGGCSPGLSGSSSVSTNFVSSLVRTLPTNYGTPELTTLKVGVVPALDAAGFFVAMNLGLFEKEGLTIEYTPAASSETAIAQQLKGQLDISAGNYVSYIRQAASVPGQPLDVISEGSVMQPGAQTLFVMPSSHITSLGQLKGKLIGVNEPKNIDYLLGMSVLKENGIDPRAVTFPAAQDRASAGGNGTIPFSSMGGDLADGKLAAAILPEPFASQAEQQYGAVPLADLNQGATNDFPVEGYVVTRAWAAKDPHTLRRFLAALSVGQEISDADRVAVEDAFEGLHGSQNGQVTAKIATVMALDRYPIGINQAQLQRVADTMYQFGLLTARYDVSKMLLPSSFFNFTPFSSTRS